ncbi:hypothetical protein BDB01DRAFT_794312 [Pilobolus umbonatus]|nr:hypothetical protein BDB01DRAFT_794312 [Pilobolus umbonatus]
MYKIKYPSVVSKKPIPAKKDKRVIPLTTEEPVRRPWLQKELDAMKEDSLERTSTDESDTYETDDSGSDVLASQNKIDREDSAEQSADMMAFLSQELQEYQDMQENETEMFEKKMAQTDTADTLLNEDPELRRITESNRHIPYKPTNEDTASIFSESEILKRSLLVFSDNPTVVAEKDRYRVIQYYGAGRSGIMPNNYRHTRPPKQFLVACDFSKESLYAMEWTMGTMMHDGYEIHVATILNRDDNPELVKESGLDQESELKATSDELEAQSKQLLNQMMLFNIKLVTHVIVGRIKDALRSLTREHDYTMLVCGSKGRSAVKRLLMGSVSTYLIHKSPVPVTVVHKPKKKKKLHRVPLSAHSLSESVKSGSLHVDELS